MNKYEELLNAAEKSNLTVTDQFDFSGTRFKGLYCDGTIALNKNMYIESEKACILAEELGHYHTTFGNILDQTNTGNRKQEHTARLWAYNCMIGLSGLIESYNEGCQSRYEIAEHLGVTEEFLEEAIKCYGQKYGPYVTVENYLITFEPLGVLELYK